MTLRIIAGLYKGRLLKTAKSSLTRPTQGMLREAVFNICQHKIEEAHFLDVYAGSGAMGFEALSRGANFVTFIEKNRVAIRCIEENIKTLQVESQTQLISADVITAFTKTTKTFDIVYIDPPYETPLYPCIEQLLQAKILSDGSVIFIEERNTKSTAPAFSHLTLKNSRRFGTAVLHQYRFG